jgi:hypothetical protein
MKSYEEFDLRGTLDDFYFELGEYKTSVKLQVEEFISVNADGSICDDDDDDDNGRGHLRYDMCRCLQMELI